MKFDQVLEAIGGFGKYQKIQFFLAAIPAAVIALHQLASVFLAATPEYRSVLYSVKWGIDVVLELQARSCLFPKETFSNRR